MHTDPHAQAIITAGDRLADAVAHEARLEDERPGQKLDAVCRLMQFANPANGKPHSASSAEAVVELDPEYAAYRAKQREATVARIKARAYYDACVYRARLAMEVAA